MLARVGPMATLHCACLHRNHIRAVQCALAILKLRRAPELWAANGLATTIQMRSTPPSQCGWRGVVRNDKHSKSCRMCMLNQSKSRYIELFEHFANILYSFQTTLYRKCTCSHAGCPTTRACNLGSVLNNSGKFKKKVSKRQICFEMKRSVQHEAAFNN